MNDLAHRAGELLVSGFQSETLKIDYKSRTDLVTDMDRKSEDFLVSSLHETFPGHTIVAEEGNSIQGREPFRWFIDPLDGTNNFAHGIPWFSVTLALYSEEKKKILAGLTYAPLSGETFHATRGGGAFLNGNPVHVSSMDDLGRSMVVTGFPYQKDDPNTNNTRECTAMVPRVQGLRRFGSAALDLCGVACGRFEGYWERGLNPWDVAAGVLICREAGGRVTDYQGKDYSIDMTAICASNGRVHDTMLQVIQEAGGRI
jgi:myo-inositol-1(or 4)-monophosphatase